MLAAELIREMRGLQITLDAAAVSACINACGSF